MAVSIGWSVKLCGAVLGSLVFLSGCATSPSPAAEQARMRTLRSELLARGDPDSLAAARAVCKAGTG